MQIQYKIFANEITLEFFNQILFNIKQNYDELCLKNLILFIIKNSTEIFNYKNFC